MRKTIGLLGVTTLALSAALALGCAPSVGEPAFLQKGDDAPPASPAAPPGGETDPGPAAPTPRPVGGFMLTGRVLPTLIAETKDLGGAGEALSPLRVTHVVAVTPSSQDTRRVVAEVTAEGRFAVDLDPARLWVLVFVDATRVGVDMVVGVYRASDLDALAPMKKGALDLGDVTAADGVATGTAGYGEVLTAMGLDPAAALLLEQVDDACTRVVNPDVDANGVIDALEEGKDYRLDFHVQFEMRTPAPVVVSDMVGAFLPASTSIAYRGTGIYTSFPAKVAPAGWQTSLSASFEEDLHYSPLGGGAPGAPRTASAGASVPGSHLLVSGYGDYGSVGLLAVPGYDMPQGTYRFVLGGHTLTFAHVQTRSDAQLAAADSFLMPFVRFVKADPSCTTSCAMGSFDYEWRRRTGAGWRAATEAEIAIVAGEKGGFLSFWRGGDSSKSVGFAIPTTAAGSVPWSAAVTPGGAGEPARIADLCHIGLSYDDKLGMRYFGGIGDAPGTCAP